MIAGIRVFAFWLFKASYLFLPGPVPCSACGLGLLLRVFLAFGLRAGGRVRRAVRLFLLAGVGARFESWFCGPVLAQVPIFG